MSCHTISRYGVFAPPSVMQHSAQLGCSAACRYPGVNSGTNLARNPNPKSKDFVQFFFFFFSNSSDISCISIFFYA
jgi:hypothetical protein